MQRCLFDPDLGYYRSRQALGARGDFITAPEISQIFGEIIGLWTAVTWRQMGEPPVALVELGPGRGTLIADALRASGIVAGFREAASLHLVEINPILRRTQAGALSDSGFHPTWHETPATLPRGPRIIIANEFLDTIPCRQWEASNGRWLERFIGVNETGQLQYALQFTEPPPKALERTASAPAPGTVLTALDYAPLVDTLFCGLGGAPHAALFIDYGHTRPGPGDTLQAVRGHAYEHPLTSPGEADLSTGVDFSAFAQACLDSGSAIDGPVTQEAFLGALGIIERSERLMANNPTHAQIIEMAVARLISPEAMGHRFKVIGVRHPSLPPFAGFETRGAPG